MKPFLVQKAKVEFLTERVKLELPQNSSYCRRIWNWNNEKIVNHSFVLYASVPNTIFDNQIVNDFLYWKLLSYY